MGGAYVARALPEWHCRMNMINAFRHALKIIELITQRPGRGTKPAVWKKTIPYCH